MRVGYRKFERILVESRNHCHAKKERDLKREKRPEQDRRESGEQDRIMDNRTDKVIGGPGHR